MAASRIMQDAKEAVECEPGQSKEQKTSNLHHSLILPQQKSEMAESQTGGRGRGPGALQEKTSQSTCVTQEEI
jgi:hypothetical protein